jgi:hypothetical protein
MTGNNAIDIIRSLGGVLLLLVLGLVVLGADHPA